MNGMHYLYAMKKVSRVPIQLRLAPGPLSQLDEAAANYSLTRSDVIRACLAVSFHHWNEVTKVLVAMNEEL